MCCIAFCCRLKNLTMSGSPEARTCRRKHGVLHNFHRDASMKPSRLPLRHGGCHVEYSRHNGRKKDTRKAPTSNLAPSLDATLRANPMKVPSPTHTTGHNIRDRCSSPILPMKHPIPRRDYRAIPSRMNNKAMRMSKVRTRRFRCH